jgi:hypothetical protein
MAVRRKPNRHSQDGSKVMDTIFITVTVLFFAVSLAYVYACEKLN